jgi:DNA-binding GntR family transcriptional regulator
MRVYTFAMAGGKLALPRLGNSSALVADGLRKMIHAGEVRAGAPLSQETIATRFGVSRIPVREALLQLEAEGLIVLQPNRGASVVELSDAEIRELYELRVLVEVDLFARAVARISEHQIRRAEAHLHIAEVEPSPVRQGELDAAFHRDLYLAAERPRQLALVESLRGSVARYERVQSALMRGTPRFLPQHRRMISACRAHSVRKARAAIKAHLLLAAELALTKGRLP